MLHSLKAAVAATLFTGLSLYIWRLAFEFSDWAAVALLPLALIIFVGFWPLTLQPWRARLRVALREDSPLSHILTGKIRALILSVPFTAISVVLLAWQSVSATRIEALIMLFAVFFSGCVFATGQETLTRHFHQPFARVIATSVVTWAVALPFTLIVAISSWAWVAMPGDMLTASLPEALQIGLNNLPARRGWIAEVLAVPYAYEAAKLWVVVQLRGYPIVGALFSLDAALISFVLCRVGIVVTQFVETHVFKAPV